MATEVKERSVPKPVFTDAEAGAKEFPSWQSRSYNYFTPRKRRATVYEDVTVDVQPGMGMRLDLRVGDLHVNSGPLSAEKRQRHSVRVHDVLRSAQARVV